eukprot:463992-Prymnesium_polylepis.1
MCVEWALALAFILIQSLKHLDPGFGSSLDVKCKYFPRTIADSRSTPFHAARTLSTPRDTPSDQPSARAPSQRAYLAFS